MAKKESKLIWLYRLKPQYATSKLKSEWLECTEEAKAKLEVMRPNYYEFKAKTPPKPTPSMEANSEKID